MKKNKVSILIPVYNRIEITKKGISQIFLSLSQLHISDIYEVIVIDDGSTDGTSDWIKQKYPQTIILYGDGNLWWSGAINVGAKYAKEHGATHLLLWNDDVKPRNDYFKNLLDLLDSDDIIYGSTILDINTGEYWFRGCHYSYKFGFTKHVREIPSKWSINCLTGMGTCLPISIIDDIGYWDNKNFPQYYGDVDYTLRAFEAGYRIIVNDNLVLYNDTRASSFNQEKSIKKYWRSMFITQSRYNLHKDILFNTKHAKLFTWRLGFFLKHLKYLINNII